MAGGSLAGSAILRVGLAVKRISPYADYAHLKQNENLSTGEVAELQRELLGRLIRYVYAHVPYYRDVFRDRRLTPEDIRSVDDLVKLPILTKEIIRREGERMLSEKVPRRRLQKRATGGSTGSPLTLWRDSKLTPLVVAGSWRNYSRCGWCPGDTTGLLWGFHESDWEMAGWKMRLREFFSRTCRVDAYNIGAAELQPAIERLRRARPKMFIVYPSAAAILAREILRSGRRIDGIAGVFSSAETLYPHHRRVIEEAFGCPVYDFYGCGEVLHVACECSAGKMHVTSDFSVVQLGEPDGEGHCPLILTGLRSLAMPFIRYANGDLCKQEETTCDCSLPFPPMSLSVARSSDVFRFGNGRVVHGGYFTQTMLGADGVESFQYHQETEDRIVLRVVRGVGFSSTDEDVIDKARRLVAEHSEGTTQVEVAFVDSIRATGIGKHRFTRSDLDTMTASA